MELNVFGSIINPTFWIKIVTLIAIAFYIIFTFVVFTQVKVMSEIISLPHAKEVLEKISLIHIILAISLFGLAIVIL